MTGRRKEGGTNLTSVNAVLIQVPNTDSEPSMTFSITL